MKRVVFDLDGTLLTGSFDFEHDYFRSIFQEEAEPLIKNIGTYLDEYERTFPRYSNYTLSRFLTTKSGLIITDEIIDGWCDVMSDVPDTIEDGIYEVLEHLKSEGDSLAVLTNWYGITQIPRLERANMLDYFDEVYTGDIVLKPHKCSYIMAKKDFDKRDCYFIGDNVDKDYIGPRSCGMNSILYDKYDNHHSSIVKVKKMNEIIERISK